MSMVEAYDLRERRTGQFLIISGRYAYDPRFGWIMDEHVASKIDNGWSPVSHTVFGEGMSRRYSVILEMRP